MISRRAGNPRRRATRICIRDFRNRGPSVRERGARDSTMNTRRSHEPPGHRPPIPTLPAFLYVWARWYRENMPTFRTPSGPRPARHHVAVENERSTPRGWVFDVILPVPPALRPTRGLALLGGPRVLVARRASPARVVEVVMLAVAELRPDAELPPASTPRLSGASWAALADDFLHACGTAWFRHALSVVPRRALARTFGAAGYAKTLPHAGRRGLPGRRSVLPPPTPRDKGKINATDCSPPTPTARPPPPPAPVLDRRSRLRRDRHGLRPRGVQEQQGQQPGRRAAVQGSAPTARKTFSPLACRRRGRQRASPSSSAASTSNPELTTAHPGHRRHLPHRASTATPRALPPLRPGRAPELRRPVNYDGLMSTCSTASARPSGYLRAWPSAPRRLPHQPQPRPGLLPALADENGQAIPVRPRPSNSTRDGSARFSLGASTPPSTATARPSLEYQQALGTHGALPCDCSSNPRREPSATCSREEMASALDRVIKTRPPPPRVEQLGRRPLPAWPSTTRASRASRKPSTST